MPHPLGPPAPELVSLAPGRAQLCWGDLPAGALGHRTNDGAIDQHHGHPGGPGGVIVRWDRAHTPERLRFDHGDGELEIELGPMLRRHGAARSTDEPLARIATISDLHLGATRFGYFKTMVERGHQPSSHPYRSAHAAITEAIEWGTDLLVIKGDAAHHRGTRFYDELGRLVDAFDNLDIVLVAGNHDVDDKGDDIDRPDTVGERAIPYEHVHEREIGGVRLLVGDTTEPGRSPGSLRLVGDDLIERAEASDDPVFVLLHHHLDPFRIPVFWPPGVPGAEANPWLDRLDAAAPGAVVSSGHCHRNRTRTHGTVRVSEVAATKDYPGVWAGYELHDDGIRQFVQRIHRPDTVGWHEYSRRAVGGIWGRYAPGRLADRCWFHEWR